MSLLNKLSNMFGGGLKAPENKNSEIYKEFTITPNPEKADGGFRIGALIEKDGQTHQLIRADVVADYDGAVETSLLKSQQVIDQMGEKIFA